MLNKQFSERFNRELDAIGVPSIIAERVNIVAKLFKLPRFKAEALLVGRIIEPNLINTIANELEVNPLWLLGENVNKNKLHYWPLEWPVT